MIGTDKRDRRKAAFWAARIAVLFFVLAPFVASLLYVRAYGVDLFYADEWDFVALLRGSDRGTLGAADLLVRHNEHVYLFPWGLMLLLGRLTGYSTVPPMYLVVVCLLITSLALFWVHARSAGRSSSLALLLFAPVPLLLFSFRQHENLLWGNQVSFAFAQTFSVLALCFLLVAGGGRPGRTVLRAAFAAAALCAAVASLSAAPGLLVWPVGVLLLSLCRAEGASRKARIGAWSLLGALVWGGYLVNPGGDLAPPLPFFVADHPLAGAGYLMTLLGGSLFWQENTAVVAGGLLALLASGALALALALRKAGENAFWVSLLSLSLLSLALITVGRSGFGDAAFAQAILSRYAAFSIPGVVALYGLLANLALGGRSRVAAGLLVVLLAAMLTGAIRSYPPGIEAGRETEQSRREAARILADYEEEPLSAFTIFGHDPERVRRYARFLDKQDYGVFAEGTGAETGAP